MKLKVCGMRNPQNIFEVGKLNPDYLGFIFYDKSPRAAIPSPFFNFLYPMDFRAKRVGVFVNADFEFIKYNVEVNGLSVIQLHGDESVLEVEKLRELSVEVIKAFSVGESFDFNQLEVYKPYVDFFLFDTKGKERGGNGLQFDWSILKGYDQEIPFFLSGGIDLVNLEQLSELKGMNLHAIDVNSKFEIEPGLKDIGRLKELKERLLRALQ